MLAQWVPLHAVSCSNLIETGGCAESREIPLRVTQTCSGCRSRSRLTTNCARSFASRRADTLLLHASVPGLVNVYARSSAYPEERAFSRETRVRVQDCGSRSSECPRSLARISSRGNSPAIVSSNVVENCLVDILRRGHLSILPAVRRSQRPLTIASDELSLARIYENMLRNERVVCSPI